MSFDFVVCLNVLEASFSNSVDPDQTTHIFHSMGWIRLLGAGGCVTC